MMKYLAGFGAVAGLLVVLILFFSPTVRYMGPVAYRADCQNRMRQIGFALLSFQAGNGHFPQPAVRDKHGNEMHSWRTLLLPYMEQASLHKRIRFDEVWNSEYNLSLVEDLNDFQCPSTPAAAGGNESKKGFTSYFLLTGPGTLFDGEKPATLDRITDDHSKTIFLVELARTDVLFSQPMDLTRKEFLEIFAETQRSARRGDLPANCCGPLSEHGHGFNVLLVDGSIEFIGLDTPLETIKAMTTIDGGEEIQDR